MSDTATIDPEVKPDAEVKPEEKQAKPFRKPQIGQEVWYWRVKQRPLPTDVALAPDETPCYAQVAGFDSDGLANLAILTTTGRWDNKMSVPFSYDPKGLHWTLKTKEF